MDELEERFLDRDEEDFYEELHRRKRKGEMEVLDLRNIGAVDAAIKLALAADGTRVVCASAEQAEKIQRAAGRIYRRALEIEVVDGESTKVSDKVTLASTDPQKYYDLTMRDPCTCRAGTWKTEFPRAEFGVPLDWRRHETGCAWRRQEERIAARGKSC